MLEASVYVSGGCDLVFEQSSELRISGQLPDGSVDSTLVRIADIPSFIVITWPALVAIWRQNPGLTGCIVNYPGGLEAIAEALAAIDNPLFRKDCL